MTASYLLQQSYEICVAGGTIGMEYAYSFQQMTAH